MKKLLRFVIPLKSFASMLFTGLISLYMAMGSLYAFLREETFTYSIPFVFILEGLVLSIVISVLWHVLFGEDAIHRTRHFPRLLIFSVSLMVLTMACAGVFFAFPTPWAKLWMVVVGFLATGLLVLALLGEGYLKATGKRYTEILTDYKKQVLPQ